MSLKLSANEVDGVLVLNMSGRLTVPEQGFRETILQHLGSGSRHFLLNLRDLSYMDSAGLGQLVSSFISLRKVGGTLRLQAPSPRVRHVLRISKLDTIFEIIEDDSPKADAKATGA